MTIPGFNIDELKQAVDAISNSRSSGSGDEVQEELITEGDSEEVEFIYEDHAAVRTPVTALNKAAKRDNTTSASSSPAAKTKVPEVNTPSKPVRLVLSSSVALLRVR